MKRIFAIFILICSFNIYAQDFFGFYWKSSLTDFLAMEGNNAKQINQAIFKTDQSEQVVDFPFKINSDSIKVYKIDKWLFNQNANILFSFVNDKLFYGIIDIKNENDISEEVISKIESVYGKPTTTNLFNPLMNNLNNEDISSYLVVLFQDAYVFSKNDNSLIGKLLKTPIDKNAIGSLNYYKSSRNRILVFKNLFPGRLTILNMENISHLEGIYNSELTHAIIIDDIIYYFIYNPNYNNYSYVAWVKEIPLHSLEVYQYGQHNDGFIYLSIEGINDIFIQSSNSRSVALETINSILNYNRQVDQNIQNETENRKIIN
jgi:hypothetical protein